MPFVLLALVAGFLFLASGKAGGPAPAGDGSDITAANFNDKVMAVLSRANLQGMNPVLLLAQAAVETGGGHDARGLATLKATNSLFNRHKGNGVEGVPNSDGYWTGDTYYVSDADADLRIYESLDQCVRDYVQLMNEGLYTDAKAAAVRGDAPAFFGALERAGYAAEPGYAAALTSRWRELGGYA